MAVQRTRTFLCPDCDGHGRTGGEQLDVDDFAPDYACLACDETGVITATYEEGERQGLQPWTGDEGRQAERGGRYAHEQRRGQRQDRTAHRDVLIDMASWRQAAARAIRNGADWRLTEYGWIRTRFAIRPSSAFARLDMIRRAILCDVACSDAVAAMRRAAA